MQQLSEYLKSLPCANVGPTPQGTETLDELVVVEIEKEVEKIKVSYSSISYNNIRLVVPCMWLNRIFYGKRVMYRFIP